jgi:predicted  nucleic acid-binding Zn-ribbon protein
MFDVRCPHCGNTRFSVLGNVILAGPLLYRGEPHRCTRCGYIFDNHAHTMEVA